MIALLGTAVSAAGGSVVQTAGHDASKVLTNLFGGSGRDAQRQARCDWFRLKALDGSPLAFRVLLGGVANTASHEAPMYTVAIATVTHDRPDVANAGYNAGGAYWDNSDNDSSDKMRAAVNAELARLELAVLGTGSGAQTLPVVTTTASTRTTAPMSPSVPKSSSSSVVMLVGAVVGVIVLLVFALRRGGA